MSTPHRIHAGTRGAHVALGTATALLLTLLCLVVLPVDVAGSEEVGWREQFDRLCGKTETAGDIPTDELQALVAECNQLLEVIRETDDPQKKLYLFRLEKCRNMFQYILDLRERNGTSQEPS